MASASQPPLSRALMEAPHSGIREIANLAVERPGTIRLEVGQPDFRTPEHISEGARAALAQGFTGYTPTAGVRSLREALAAKLEKVNGIRVEPGQVTIGPGGVGAIAAVLAALVEPGAEVLLPDPGWPNYRLMIAATQTVARFYPCPPEMGFQPDLEALEALIGDGTRILVVNSPNNPTGAVYPTSTLQALVEMAERHNLWLIADDCYDQIVLDGAPESLGRLDSTGRVISCFTFSKTYAMTGWRVGYAAGPAQVIDSTIKVLESNSSCVSSISQRAAEAALAGPQDCVEEMLQAYRRRRDLACELLQEAGLLIAEPRGAFYVMADVSAADMPSREFALALLDARGVSVAPGTAFGQVAEGSVRISLASAEEDLREGIARLAEFAAGGGGPG